MPLKNPALLDKVVLKDGASVETEAGTAIISVSAAGVPTIEADIEFDASEGIQDNNGNELLGFSVASSAVNYIDIGNAATGSNPSVTAAGGDSSIGFDFNLKGTGDFGIISTDAGTLGAVLTLIHESASPADFDAVGLIDFEGLDDALNEHTYGRIAGVASDVSNGTEAGLLVSYVSAGNDGALEAVMTLASDGTEADLIVGDSTGAGGTIDATIGSPDGGNLSIRARGTGVLKCIETTALAAGTLVQAPEQVFVYEFAAGTFDANDDLVIYNASGPAMYITDVQVVVDTVEGGALTGTLRDAANGGGNAISSALDLNSTSLERTATLTNNELGSSSSLYFNASGNPGTVAGKLVIRALIQS